MDKMRWFIIGNLIGFAVLIGGIALNDSFRHREKEPDSPGSGSTESSPSGQNMKSNSSSPSGQNMKSNSSSQSGPSTVAIPGGQAGQPDRSGHANEQTVKDGTDKDTITRVVTTRDINKGTVLHAGDIELRQVEHKRAKPAGLTAVEPALGQKTRIDLIEGEMLEAGDLEKP